MGLVKFSGRVVEATERQNTISYVVSANTDLFQHLLIPELNPMFPDFNGSSKAQRVIRMPAPRAEELFMMSKIMTSQFCGDFNMILDGTWAHLNEVFLEECKGMQRVNY